MPKKMPGSIQKKSKKMNPIVCVNRSIYPPYPAYPYRMVKVTHPGLDKIGPARFDIRKLKPWLHNKQKSDQWIHGYEIYEYLIAEKILQSCLGLLDLVEIKKRGPIFFRQYFKDKAANAWKSVGVDLMAHRPISP